VASEIKVEFGWADPMLTDVRRFAFMLGFLWLTGAGLPAADGKIVKVLQHYLDAQGRHTLSPSLYERDAYQVYLRKNPDKRSALRFDIQWKVRGVEISRLTLRMEVRGSQAHRDKPLILEQPAKRNRGLGRWSSMTIEGDAFKQLGEVVAWRATLWAGDQPIAEQRSFLW
jgi:hypothetical protein